MYSLLSIPPKLQMIFTFYFVSFNVVDNCDLSEIGWFFICVFLVRCLLPFLSYLLLQVLCSPKEPCEHLNFLPP